MSESAYTYYDSVVSGVENRERLCLDSMIGSYPGTAKRGSLVKAQPGERKEIARRLHQQVFDICSVLVEADKFPFLTMILFFSEAEPASSTTSCRIYYNRLALLEDGYALSDLVHIPCGFVAEGYRILD